MAKQYKRRLIPVVDRRFQFKYTAIIISIAAIVSIILGYLLWKSYAEMNAILKLSATISDDIAKKINADDARFVFQISIAFLLVEVIVLGIMGIVITHRITGPVFVVSRHLETLRDGSYPTLRPLRANDEFQGFFDAFSDTIKELRHRDESALERVRKVREAAAAAGVDEEHLGMLDDLISEQSARVEDEGSAA
jgi:methyl-accepting chemotaxis protein